MATVTGPSPVVFVPSSEAVTVFSCTVDMQAWQYSVSYGDVGALTMKTATGAVPPALQAGMLANAKLGIEMAEGWTPGSSVATP